jgi:hypothetical protein
VQNAKGIYGRKRKTFFGTDYADGTVTAYHFSRNQESDFRRPAIRQGRRNTTKKQFWHGLRGWHGYCLSFLQKSGVLFPETRLPLQEFTLKGQGKG